MAKERSPIPEAIAARLLFDSDRVCCVCRNRGLRVQIHHIDDDPTNHEPVNLAVLCFECHDHTQTRGGFGRTLDPAQVIEYRDDWHARVVKRRDTADEIASGREVHLNRRTTSTLTRKRAAALFGPSKLSDHDLLAYVRALPDVRKEAYRQVRRLFDSGVTTNQMQAAYDVIDVMGQAMVRLASWYPPNHFGERPVEEYIASLVASRFVWHRALMEPEGAGRGGTIVGPLTAGAVITDVEDMVADMVWSLTLELGAPVGGGRLRFKTWDRRWRSAAYPGVRRATEGWTAG